MNNPYRAAIQSFPNFPKPGVMYWDFTGLLMDPSLFSRAIADLAHHFQPAKPTKIAAIEAKGFAIGGALAHFAKLPLVLIRKPGLTPGTTQSQLFTKEYGTASYELKDQACGPGDRVLIVYDIMAGPGATQAAISLVEQSGATVVGCAYVIELAYLNGRQDLAGYNLKALVTIEAKPYL